MIRNWLCFPLFALDDEKVAQVATSIDDVAQPFVDVMHILQPCPRVNVKTLFVTFFEPDALDRRVTASPKIPRDAQRGKTVGERKILPHEEAILPSLIMRRYWKSIRALLSIGDENW